MTAVLMVAWALVGALAFTAVCWWLYMVTDTLITKAGKALRKARYRWILKLRTYARRTYLRDQHIRSDTTWALANLLAFTSSDARLNRNTDG